MIQERQAHEHDDRGEDVVIGRDVEPVGGQRAERRSRDALDAVLAAGQLAVIEGDEVDHLGKRQRDHREVDPAGARHDQAGQKPRPGQAQQQREHQGEQHVVGRRVLELMSEQHDREALGVESGRVGSEREEHRVAERQLAHVAEQEIEAAREEREDEHRRADVHEPALMGERVGTGYERQHDEQYRRPDQRVGQRVGTLHSNSPSTPNKPRGRTSRMIPMMT